MSLICYTMSILHHAPTTVYLIYIISVHHFYLYVQNMYIHMSHPPSNHLYIPTFHILTITFPFPSPHILSYTHVWSHATFVQPSPIQFYLSYTSTPLLSLHSVPHNPPDLHTHINTTLTFVQYILLKKTLLCRKAFGIN